MSDVLRQRKGCEVLPPRRREGGDSRPTRKGASEAPPKRTANRRVSHDRFTILNQFVDFSLGELRRNQIAVWLVLYRDSRDGTAQVSQAAIAKRVGATDRTVRNAIRSLEKLGLVKVVHQGGLNRGPSRYRVLSLITPADP